MRQEDMSRVLLGRGIYSVPEAARITDVSTARIRRWLLGYTYAGGIRHSRPVFVGQLPVVGGQHALSFRDLIEVRFVDAFLRADVSWKTLRAAHEKARAIVGSNHPFATGRFKTAGRAILLDTDEEEQDAALLDLIKDQWVFKRFINPYLRGLDFEEDGHAARWFPLATSGSRRIVIDPRRSFGQPIVARYGVPTRTLADAYAVEQSIAKVARWFEVDPKDVKDAVAYEAKLAA